MPLGTRHSPLPGVLTTTISIGSTPSGWCHIFNLQCKCITVKIGEAKKCNLSPKYVNFLEIVGLCNIHHWLKGGWMPLIHVKNSVGLFASIHFSLVLFLLVHFSVAILLHTLRYKN